MADLRAQALGYLRSGAVEVQQVTTVKDGDENTTRTIMATVRGHHGSYVVDGRIGFDYDGAQAWAAWACTCRNYTTDVCAHRAAVQLITGGQTTIRPDERVAQHAGHS